MMQMKQLVFVFLPAIGVAAFAFFIAIIQYEPLYPKTPAATEKEAVETLIPILPDDPVMGDKKAPLTLIAFADFGCEACREHMTIIRGLLSEYPKQFKVIWKGLPVTLIPYSSEWALRYAICANRQEKFAAFESLAFERSIDLSPASGERLAAEITLDREKLSECLEDPALENYLETTKDIARLYHIQSVPTYFVANAQVPTPTTVTEWKQLLSLE